MHSDANSVEQYLKELTEERRSALIIVRNIILDNLAEKYVEIMRRGMITYEIPLEIRPDTYNGEPLMYVALASQKQHMAIYLMSLYSDEETKEKMVSQWKARGTRLNMGKSCIRFTKIEKLELDLIAEAIRRFSVEEYLEHIDSISK
jgi:hypothetical protein|tara:strand:+ start:194 stop:634 length:441 start_codon:yes stop_codon:yes gene_type:complete